MPRRSSPELVRRGVRPDCVTDQTSAHDPVNGYLPGGWTIADWEDRRDKDGPAVARAARRSMAEHVRAMLAFHRMGVPTVDYGNNIRQMALEEGVADAFDFPGFVPAYISPSVLPRRGAVPLGGALWRPRGYLPHRREGQRAAAGQPGFA